MGSFTSGRTILGRPSNGMDIVLPHRTSSRTGGSRREPWSPRPSPGRILWFPVERPVTQTYWDQRGPSMSSRHCLQI